MVVSKFVILRSRADWARLENGGSSLNLTIPSILFIKGLGGSDLFIAGPLELVRRIAGEAES